MVKILETLVALPAGAELRARTDRRPMHLYAQLEERGFAAATEEQPDGSFLTHIPPLIRQRASGSAAPLLGANAPSVALPLMFTLTGLLALMRGHGLARAPTQPPGPLPLQPKCHRRDPPVCAGLDLLGRHGSDVSTGAGRLETKLYSERLARWQFVFHVVGFIGMVWMFRVWNMKQVGHFGSVLAVGVGLFVYNIARTLWRVPKWNVTATAVSAALAWISLTVILGLSIAAAKCVNESESESAATPTGVGALLHGLKSVRLSDTFGAISTMHAHAHLGGVGFFTMLIVGVSYKLIPMFTLSELQSRRRAVAASSCSMLGWRVRS